MKHWLDIVILLVGDYTAIGSVILSRIDEIIDSNDYKLLLYAGTALAANNESRYQNCFEAALRIKNVEFEDSLIIHHRIAVANLKRSHNLNEFNKQIDLLLSSYNMGKSKNFWLILELINNLSGLSQVKEKTSKTILNLTMINADSILNAALLNEPDELRSDMILRYLGQVAINRAQLLMHSNQLGMAKEVLVNSLKRNLANNSLYAGGNVWCISSH
ncbi:hypothetical protein FE407_08020 [Leuconostoc carnosum]|uniref:hypothetical protein n=1 Tax=Leuconostoc TaxID=1243 RepID=UPI000D51DE69|nr:MULTISPECIES: hypothetical protein [Leuconostoc]KAA8324533.1 hypothetical protein FE404_07535 [Leuconostoc carnosum]KAA8358206.1 hypothetical protein FE407_08020 [Leuconostoc carnosum]KAA8364704.1 hypothetical protein FE406_08015 [Leuconostoc carnosum]KAA8365577.1 hypothetical protein FE416_08325 [Leuconostoc carnosum]KAA8371605.1 hypothetical protein FE415_08515 [Leuconostoc carnosum]